MVIIKCEICGKRRLAPGSGTKSTICNRCLKKLTGTTKIQKIRRVFARAIHEIKIIIKFCRLSPADVRVAIDAPRDERVTWRQMELEIARI